MNDEGINQSIHGEDRGTRRDGRERNANKKRDSTTGRFIPVGTTFDAKLYYIKNRAHHSAEAKKRYAANPEPAKQRAKEWSRRNRERIKARRKEYRLKNRSKLQAKNRAYRMANLAKVKERNKLYTQSHPEQRKAIQHRYNTSPKGRSKMRIWTATKGKLPKHRAKRIACDARRRALEISQALPDADAAIQILSVKERQKCFYCGRIIPKGELHIDHLNPLSGGGAHAAYNLVPSCKTCNLRKSDKHPNEFVPDQKLLVF